jgi:hypothetical protein
MLEYSAVLSKGMGAWTEEFAYAVASIYSSSYFWPGVVAVTVMLIFVGRFISK